MVRLLLFILLIGGLASSPSRAADSPSKAVFAYGAINAYMTSTWVAREQGFFLKHNVEIEPVFIYLDFSCEHRLGRPRGDVVDLALCERVGGDGGS